MNRIRARWMLALGLLVAAAAIGADAPVPGPDRPPEMGRATRLWLQQQRQGENASPKAQPLSGPVLEQVHERYRKSFSLPIPERFQRDSVSSGAAGY